MKKINTLLPPHLSKLLTRRIFAVLMILSLVASPVLVGANRYQNQIDSINEEIAEKQEVISELQGRANTLQNRLRLIAAEKEAIQAKIDKTEAEKLKLDREIAQTERQKDQHQRVLASTIGDLYVGASVSPIEMLASSKNIGEYIDQAEYQSSIRDSLQDSIKQINELKAKLDKQKAEVEKVIARQKGERSQLIAKEGEQSRILAQTRGEESRYKEMVSDLQDKRAKAEAALAATLASGNFSVSPEGYVSAGDVVGAVGNTGFSSGAHLHLEVRVNGSPANPASYIQSDPLRPPNVTQGYGVSNGWYFSGVHMGIDYAVSQGGGEPVHAIAPGTLYRGCSNTVLGTSGNDYGYVAIVDHGSGVQSVYAHMSGGPAACNYNTFY